MRATSSRSAPAPGLSCGVCGVAVSGAPLLFELHHAKAQLLVLVHQLFGELGAALEEGLDELALGLDEVELRERRLVVRFRHSRPAIVSREMQQRDRVSKITLLIS